jgi:hypothetical protein
VISIGVRCKENVVPGYSVLIDSGADDCIFHAEIADVLGIDFDAGPTKNYSGIGFGDLEGRRHTVEIQLGGYWLRCEVTFCRGMTRQHPNFPQLTQGLRYGILGQYGFFDKFKVMFDYAGEEIELRPRDRNLLNLS